MSDKPTANRPPPPGRIVWPFPPATGPTPWTPGQLRDYNRQQPKNPPPPPAQAALW